MFDLKRFRREKKISQQDFASAMECGQSFISQIENGKDRMPDTWIDKIANIYNVTNIEEYIIPDNILENQVYYGGDQSNINGDNINGNNVTVNKSNTDKLLDLLASKESALIKAQEQIDKLLVIIERLTK
jgi:transcriptional regulator with XRE-family HTH domain